MLSLMNVSSCIHDKQDGAMWRVDDCFFQGYVFYYWVCRSNVSVISFRMCLCFPTIVFDHVVDIFYLSLPEGDKVFLSDDSGTVSWLLALDKILK